jgi:hypothetical protein
MAKARAGSVVSSLPVGWIKGPDGKYDYDLAVKDVIHAIIDTFKQQRSIRQTVKALKESGIKVPSRDGRKLRVCEEIVYARSPNVCWYEIVFS